MKQVYELIKKGNKSSAIAMIGNTLIALTEFIAGAISGSGAMFAAAMHSLVDAVNQGFIFIGSILSKKKTVTQVSKWFRTLEPYFQSNSRIGCIDDDI
ncbi:cation transporter [Neobacillus pocheonensis]|uniref:cation transporter n=1 Tax=Neobacillus pocheonensis TaxID=363869 RepID=UPI003D2C63C3